LRCLFLLLYEDLDSAEQPACIFNGGTSRENWERLRQAARTELLRK
jgi:hypothetical protein